MTLKKLCLASIVQAIDLYSRAYTTVDNEYLQQGFYILQKIYSDELISSLVCNRLLKEEHADLVFNKYIKSIDTEWFSTYSWNKIMDIFEKIGPSLEKVTFSHNKGATEWKRIIRHLPNVKEITYTSGCSDDVLQHITEYCPCLEKLDIRNSYNVTGAGVIYFCQVKKGRKRDSEGECLFREEKVPCPGLKEIFVENTTVTDEGIKQLLINLPSLERIDSSRLPYILLRIHKDNLASLYKTERLTHVNLSGFEHPGFYDSAFESCVALCPNLKSLVCRVHKLAHLNLCRGLTNVADLDLDINCDQRISVSEICHFLKEQGRNITSLTFRGCTVRLPVLGHSCPRLNSLMLEQVVIQSNETGPLPVLYNLKEFIVNEVDLDNPVNCEGICSILRSSPALGNLHLLNCLFFPPELENAILKCCEQSSLEFFTISSCNLDEMFLVKVLRACSTLKSLTLDECEVHYEWANCLRWIAVCLPNKPSLQIDEC